MECISENAPRQVLIHVDEIVYPISEYAVRVHVAGQYPRRRAYEFEMRIVVQRPADRHFDEPRGSPEYGGLLERDVVRHAYTIWRVIVGHHAAVVDEAVLEQQLD